MEESLQRLIERTHYPVYLGSFITVFGGDSGLFVYTRPNDWNSCSFTVHYQLENYRSIELTGTMVRAGNWTHVAGSGQNIGVMIALMVFGVMACGVVFASWLCGAMLALITLLFAAWYMHETSQIRDRMCALLIQTLAGQPSQQLYMGEKPPPM
jgi:hypothetical protein